MKKHSLLYFIFNSGETEEERVREMQHRTRRAAADKLTKIEVGEMRV